MQSCWAELMIAMMAALQFLLPELVLLSEEQYLPQLKYLRRDQA